MLFDAREVDPGRTLDTEVCIVGAGAAGIAIARELAAAGIDVCVLEGGGFDFDPDSIAFYEGTVEGPFPKSQEHYLTLSRLRFFGGTTNHWEGWCRPLDRLDFETRSWIPHSGWPFDREALAPYLVRAADEVQIPPFEGEPVPAFSIPDCAFVTRVFHMSPPTRFGRAYRAALVDSPRVGLYLHANVTELELAESGRELARVRVSALPGRAFHVRARRFVLAAGAIENARLLLVSDGRHEAGVGNGHDIVGRYFMDHPHLSAGYAYITGAATGDWLERHRFADLPGAKSGASSRRIGLLGLSEPAQRRLRLPNVHVYLRAPAGRVPKRVREWASTFDTLASSADSPAAPDGALLELRVRSEPIPDPASRVRLGAERDPLGVRRVHLDWRVTDADGAAILEAVTLLAQELGASGVGRAQLRVSADRPWANAESGSHHLGTTRMHDDPRRGVVDADCRIHGVANLYVAGSSVFPTAGASNPTLTLLALALRLADHLTERRSDPA